MHVGRMLIVAMIPMQADASETGVLGTGAGYISPSTSYTFSHPCWLVFSSWFLFSFVKLKVKDETWRS